MSARPWLLVSMCSAVACSSASEAKPGGSDGGSEIPSTDSGGAQSVAEAAPGASTVHGTMVDFETLDPVRGLTVTSGSLSATTDANGLWSLDTAIGSTLHITVTSSTYSYLLFPDLVAESADVDLSTVVIPDSSTYSLEEQILPSFDDTKALVQIVILTAPTCASPVGGTITVTSPGGAMFAYFDSSAMPSTAVTSFQQVQTGRPEAVVYNVDPTATLAIQVTHPTCTQMPFPATFGGRQYLGTAPLQAAEPGGVNSALVFILQ